MKDPKKFLVLDIINDERRQSEDVEVPLTSSTVNINTNTDINTVNNNTNTVNNNNTANTNNYNIINKSKKSITIAERNTSSERLTSKNLNSLQNDKIIQSATSIIRQANTSINVSRLIRNKSELTKNRNENIVSEEDVNKLRGSKLPIITNITDINNINDDNILSNKTEDNLNNKTILTNDSNSNLKSKSKLNNTISKESTIRSLTTQKVLLSPDDHSTCSVSSCDNSSTSTLSVDTDWSCTHGRYKCDQCKFDRKDGDNNTATKNVIRNKVSQLKTELNIDSNRLKELKNGESLKHKYVEEEKLADYNNNNKNDQNNCNKDQSCSNTDDIDPKRGKEIIKEKKEGEKQIMSNNDKDKSNTKPDKKSDNKTNTSSLNLNQKNSSSMSVLEQSHKRNTKTLAHNNTNNTNTKDNNISNIININKEDENIKDKVIKDKLIKDKNPIYTSSPPYNSFTSSAPIEPNLSTQKKPKQSEQQTTEHPLASGLIGNTKNPNINVDKITSSNISSNKSNILSKLEYDLSEQQNVIERVGSNTYLYKLRESKLVMMEGYCFKRRYFLSCFYHRRYFVLLKDKKLLYFRRNNFNKVLLDTDTIINSNINTNNTSNNSVNNSINNMDETKPNTEPLNTLSVQDSDTIKFKSKGFCSKPQILCLSNCVEVQRAYITDSSCAYRILLKYNDKDEELAFETEENRDWWAERLVYIIES